ncbi:hypothetical protein ACFWAP_00845 [Streptomyces goshikiensis]|uniref:hypothetical protein n=1 Tax=Streptomyces goshikiensis TaxID=1942 RepID=UPI0036642F33
MAVNFDLSEIKSYKRLWISYPDSGRQLNGVTETLVFSMLAIGVQRISERNWSEVLWRLRQHEELYGALLMSADGPVSFSEKHVRRNIGLRVNASLLTDAQFDADMRRRRKAQEAERQYIKAST